MASSGLAKIYLSKDGKLYKFVSYGLTKSDGSLVVNLLRNGTNEASSIFDNVKLQPIDVNFEHPRPKTKKITYHSSGCVNYHNCNHPSNYFEPLSNITAVNCFATWSIPKIDCLDSFEDSPSDKDLVVECDYLDRVYFSLCIARWDETPDYPHIAVRYPGLFSLLIAVHEMPLKLPVSVNSHFLFIAPRTGLYDTQQLSENIALIKFFQLSHNTKDLILISPDVNGVYKIIFATQMRSTPKLTIEFANKENILEICPLSDGQIKAGKETVMMKFKVKDRHGNYIKKETKITSIELDSEL